MSNKHIQKKTSSASQKLARLADYISDDSFSPTDEAALVNLIRGHLENGRDDILSKCWDETKTAQGYEYLNFLVANCSQTIPITLNAYEPGEATTYAIPIVMCVEPGVGFPDKLKDMDICKTIREYDLIGRNPSLFLHNEYLCLDDISLSPSKRSLLTRDLFNMYEDLTNTPKSLRRNPVKEGGQQCKLRFLVGIVVADLDETVLYSKDMEAYASSRADWTLMMESYLAEQTGIAAIICGAPGVLDLAVREGMSMFKEVSLRMKATMIVNELAEKRSICRSIMSMHQNKDEREIRISFLDSQNNLVGGYAWDVLTSDDAIDVSGLIHSTIKGAGVDEVVVVDDIMPITTCECCGEPDFLTMPGESGHSSALH